MMMRSACLLVVFVLVCCNRREVDQVIDTKAKERVELNVTQFEGFSGLMDAVRERLADEPLKIRLSGHDSALVVEFLASQSDHGLGCPALLRIEGADFYLGDARSAQLPSSLDQLKVQVALLQMAASAAMDTPVLLLMDGKDAELATGMEVLEVLAAHGIVVLLHVDR